MTLKQPTLKMIAERTGYAVTTVSKALHDAPNIGAKTKKYIQDVAKEVGYQPDRAGLSLRTGNTHKIILLMQLSDDISDFSRRLILGMARTLETTPYELVFHPVLPGRDELSQMQSIVRNRAADGLVLAQTAPDDARVAFAQSYDFPVVTHGRTQLSLPHAFYDFDNEAFAFEAGSRLAALGCETVGLLTPECEFTFFTHLQKGLRHAAELNKLAIQEKWNVSIPGDNYLQWLRDESFRAVQSGTMPDGVICSNELAVLAVMDGVNAAGGKLGKDVKIISRKTSRLLDYLHPDIEWVEEDLILAGEHLAQLLLKRIQGTDPKQLQIVGSPAISW
ncbi:LacI family DNA-binding transcriptional regulator [Maritalea mediterranea]|uniref:LacI family DNA-binding transcriptional regulator n=1 Tax=Maritalea mediterranea TaxID=2909667 RepID=A0ABS9E7E4_9HYPH|nr:LacI family DNA-binding transcriptional regulator [Maritalea mediterranea]MCF4097353.1 LacI family DNA-binding transcriptional regulator [Maritalea mediterranea]